MSENSHILSIVLFIIIRQTDNNIMRACATSCVFMNAYTHGINKTGTQNVQVKFLFLKVISNMELIRTSNFGAKLMSRPIFM